MILVGLVALIASQPAAAQPTTAQTEARVAIRAAGSSPALHQELDAIEAAARSKRFDRAQALTARLPKAKFFYRWDDRKVPATVRDEFRSVRDRVLRDWMSRIPGLIIAPAPAGQTPEVKFSFEPKLAPNPENGLPLGLAILEGPANSRLKYEFVIGLNRGRPTVATSPKEVGNELSYAIGTYLGISTAAFRGPIMWRSDEPTQIETRITRVEVQTVQQNLRVVSSVRQAVQNRQLIPPRRPKAFIDPMEVNLGGAVQGENLSFTVQISNAAEGPLAYNIDTDCGCLTADRAGMIEGAKTRVVRGWLDTVEFTGKLEKRFVVHTNDPDNPTHMVMVRADVKPRAMFFRPGGSVIVRDGGEIVTDAYLVWLHGEPLEAAGVRTQGLPATAAIEPWEGEVNDPETGKPVGVRAGYRIAIRSSAKAPPGRSPINVVVDTFDRQFPRFTLTLQVQEGIAAQPANLFLGALGPREKRLSFTVSRPGRGFRIMGVETDSEFLSASAAPVQGTEEYRVTVLYRGGAPAGTLNGIVRVKTDDPGQPVVLVPVRGRVE